MRIQDIIVYVLLAIIILQMVLSVTVFPIFKKKRDKKAIDDQKKLIKEIKNGHEVILVSGIFGKVVNKKDNFFWVEIAPGVTIKVTRNAIAGFFDEALKKQHLKDLHEGSKVKR